MSAVSVKKALKKAVLWVNEGHLLAATTRHYLSMSNLRHWTPEMIACAWRDPAHVVEPVRDLALAKVYL